MSDDKGDVYDDDEVDDGSNDTYRKLLYLSLSSITWMTASQAPV